jgi:hypothetical protein
MKHVLSAVVLTAMVSVACAGEIEQAAVSAGFEGMSLSGLERIETPAPNPKAAGSELPVPEQRLSTLATLLKGAGAIQMPPAGIRNGATDLEVKVEIADCGGNGSTHLIESKVAETLDYWNATVSGNAATLTALQADGIHVTYEAGQNSVGVRDYLIKSLVRKEDRAAVQALLKTENFGADYALIATYNIESEIIGHEIVIIKPWDGSKALIIELNYVAA